LDKWYRNHPSYPINAGQKYKTFYPMAMYPPWNLDPEFLAMLTLVSPLSLNKDHIDSPDAIRYTLLDKYRLWELYTLTFQTIKLEAGDYLEVGV
jgi:hypothetical protein